MEEAMDFFRLLFTSGDFQPHGFCYQGNTGLVWLDAISDRLIASAYFTIPITLLHFIRKRRDILFSWMFRPLRSVHRRLGHGPHQGVCNLWRAKRRRRADS
jgi:hypothetical protein